MPDTALPPHAEPDLPASATDRVARIQREAETIARGQAQIDAGLGIDGETFERWLDALEDDPDAPLPGPSGHGVAAGG